MFNTRNKSGISAHPCIILYIIYIYLTNLFGSMYIYITHLKARSKTARYERDSLKSSHARHLPASNYMIICTVIYLYTHSIHIRTLTDKAHRDGLHTHRSRPARAILSCERKHYQKYGTFCSRFSCQRLSPFYMPNIA